MAKPRVKRITSLEATKLFFKKRFPSKFRSDGTIWDTGYFDDWVGRFRSGSPERWADSESLRAIQGLRKKGYVWG